MDHLAQLESDLRPMAQMLRGHLGQIETKIEVAERELKELREARQKIFSLARHVDPSLVPAPKPRKDRNVGSVSEEKLTELTDWLRTHDNGGVVSVPAVFAAPEFELMSRATLSKAFAALHERGVLRLDSIGRGGRKSFKVVA